MILRSLKTAIKISTLCLLAFLAGPVHSHALTLGDLKVSIRQRINDRTDPVLRYSDTMLLTFINEGQRDLVNRTWCLQKSTSIALVARTTYYSLPDNVIAIQEFNFRETTTSRTRQLAEKSQRALYQENPDYERQPGPPFYYFTRPVPSGFSLQFGINPVPSTATALGTALIQYYNQSTDLSTNSAVPLDGDLILYPYHSALVYFVVAKIKMMEGDTNGAAAYEQMYGAQVTLMMDRLGRMPNYNPGFSGPSGR